MKSIRATIGTTGFNGETLAGQRVRPVLLLVCLGVSWCAQMLDRRDAYLTIGLLTVQQVAARQFSGISQRALAKNWLCTCRAIDSISALSPSIGSKITSGLSQVWFST